MRGMLIHQLLLLVFYHTDTQVQVSWLPFALLINNKQQILSSRGRLITDQIESGQHPH